MFKFVIDEVAATRELVFKLVEVALVSVALEDVKFEVEAFKIFPVIAFVVVAFVVEAFKTAKLAVVPKSVPIVAEVKLAMAAYNELKMFKFVIDEVAATRELVLMLVDVELVIVLLVEFKLVRFPVVPVI